MDWSQTSLRLRFLIIIEFIVLALMVILVYGTTYTSPSEVQTESASNVWIVLFFFVLAIIGLLFQIVGLIGLLSGKQWAKHFYLLGVCASAISSISGKVGMSGNWFLALVALCHWMAAGAIIALSYEKQSADSVTRREV